MIKRRIVLGSISIGVALLAGFPLQGAGATSVPTPTSTGSDGFGTPGVHGVSLVGNEAEGIDTSVGVVPVLHRDPVTGRTSYSFIDEP